jgi:hypothetical protein
MKMSIHYFWNIVLFLKHLWNTISELGLPLLLGAVSCSLLGVIRRRLKWQFTHIQHYDRVRSYQQKTCCFITILLFFPSLILCVLCGWYVGPYVGLSMSLAMMLVFTGTSSILNEAYPDKFVAAWMRIWLTFLVTVASWLLGNIMTESAHCFCKCNRNSGCRFFIAGCWDFCKLLFTYLQPLSGADEVMAACHC